MNEAIESETSENESGTKLQMFSAAVTSQNSPKQGRSKGTTSVSTSSQFTKKSVASLSSSIKYEILVNKYSDLLGILLNLNEALLLRRF